ncbi:MAG TPA: hypothetical protein VJV23_17275 [Candidatus Polarisedimenticolia bacterium]|nr:hypothetical protein [Candidatus Polarisedimenticolia bacterium]
MLNDAEVEALFCQMVAQQRAKVLGIARSLDARLTQDDVLSPQDFPALAEDTRFSYEDGLLAGLLSAQAAVRALAAQRRGA